MGEVVLEKPSDVEEAPVQIANMEQLLKCHSGVLGTIVERTDLYLQKKQQSQKALCDLRC